MPHDNAPLVSYPAGRTARLAWLLALLWLAALAAILGAFFSGAALSGRWISAIFSAALVILSGWSCLAFWRGQRARTLLWDGERWSLEPGDGQEYQDGARVQVRMDLQRLMLLCFEAPRSPRRVRRVWLWAEAAHDPARWHLLRCALYSSQPPAAVENDA